jgi:serine phosphatase RsbU (regulator of sigma subunit)
LSLVARYRAADGAAQIGGDFFDAFQTEDGRTHVVIGDVQGHSLEAAVLMAELRYSLRAFVHDGYAPKEVLTRVDETLARSRPDMTATLCLVTLAPAGPDGTRAVEVANAGHLPPLLVRDGAASYLDAQGPLLGALLGPAEPMHTTAHPGDRLVLITDGLVERRGEDLGENLERFAHKVSGSSLSAEALCDAVMADHGDVGDDSALVLVDVLVP